MNIPSGAVVTISGDRFSSSGNTVIVEQGSERYVIEKDANWMESPAQISAKLPAALKPGRAQLYVVNAQGREGNASAFTVARSLDRRPPIKREQQRQQSLRSKIE